MLTHEMQMRAELLGKVLEAGVHPAAALDQARQLWGFVNGDPAPIEVAAIAADQNMIVGIRLDANGRWRRVDVAGFDLAVDTFAAHSIYSRIRPVLQDGQALVEIPAFYIRVDRNGDDRTWLVSSWPAEGFKLHPAFRRADGRPAAAIRVGAYVAGEHEGRVVVEAGRKPWTSIDFHAAEARVGELGCGWRLWSIYDLSAIQILAMIELGGADMQGLVAPGNVRGGGAVGGGESGATWRGLHELWGNVWQMVNGLRVAADGVICVWSADRPGSGEWIRTGVEYGPGADDGFPTSFHEERGDGFDLSLLFLPDDVTAAADDAAISDWVWGHWGSRETVAYSGGYWGTGANAGVFALHLALARSYASAGIGFRPAFAI